MWEDLATASWREPTSGAKQEEGDLTIRDGELYEKTVSGRNLAIGAGVVTAIVVAIAMTKATGPYLEIKNERNFLDP